MTVVPCWTLYSEVDVRLGSTRTLELLSVSQTKGVLPRSEITDKEHRAEDLTSYKVCRKGDIILNRMSAYHGALGASPQEGIVSPDYAVLRCNTQVDPRYLASTFKTAAFVGEMTSRLRGIGSVDSGVVRTPRLSVADLGHITIDLPSMDHQRHVMAFLDRETAQIDELIGKQNALIELLGERRMAVITRAVTKGLDPSVPMKKTGSERLPQIPEGWTFPEIGWNAFVGNGSTPNRDTVDFWLEGTIPWLNSSHVNRDRVEDSDQFVTECARIACHLPMVALESVLVGLTGEGKTRGMATVLGIPATINQHLAYLTPHGGRLRAQFLYWTIAASYAALRELSGENGSTKGGLTCSALKHFRIALPPLAEQDRICAHLDATTRQIDRTVGVTREFVARATERRSALITAAVTGKIDVRGAA